LVLQGLPAAVKGTVINKMSYIITILNGDEQKLNKGW
jgi:hypothetical protein